MTLSGLKEKYRGWHKKLTYSELIKRINAHNTEKIVRSLGRISEGRYRQAAEAAMGKKRVIEMPDWETTVPPRAYFLKKGFDNGEMITDTLRRRLTANLREAMVSMEPGKRFDASILPDLEAKIKDTMSAYTRAEGGRVPNVHNIAVTEARGAYNEVKHEYMRKMYAANSDRINLVKKWIHNNRLVKDARPGHLEMNRVEIPFNQKFTVTRYSRVKKAWVPTGSIQMDHPHDPNSPIGEKANCQCDYEVRVLIIRGNGLQT